MGSAAPHLLIRNVRTTLAGVPSGERASIHVADGRIAAVASSDESIASSDEPRAEEIEGAGLWALPGWIDLQVNDIEWLARGQQAPEDHAARIRDVLRYQSSRGVTGCVLATLAAPLDEIVAYLDGMRRVLDGDGGLDRVFVGALVEGTFMNPAFHGAHNPDWVLAPDAGVLDRLLATGAVRLINIAPEMSPDAIALIERATRAGVVVGCGHAKPHAERVREAVAAGLRYVIHLGNGPTGSHWKRFHDGGLLEETLRNDAILATMIVDGWHVHPEILRDWIARKEVSRSIGVSDAGFAMGPPGERFEVFGITGEMADDGSYLRVVPSPDATPANPFSSDVSALFGAAVGMREVFENLVRLFTRDMAGVHQRRHEALGLGAAVEAASTMCSSNPAALLGATDRGRLSVGQRADIVLVEIRDDGGEIEVSVRETFVGGERRTGPGE